MQECIRALFPFILVFSVFRSRELASSTFLYHNKSDIIVLFDTKLVYFLQVPIQFPGPELKLITITSTIVAEAINGTPLE
jgi:hypothetical protein